MADGDPAAWAVGFVFWNQPHQGGGAESVVGVFGEAELRLCACADRTQPYDGGVYVRSVAVAGNADAGAEFHGCAGIARPAARGWRCPANHLRRTVGEVQRAGHAGEGICQNRNTTSAGRADFDRSRSMVDEVHVFTAGGSMGAGCGSATADSSCRAAAVGESAGGVARSEGGGGVQFGVREFFVQHAGGDGVGAAHRWQPCGGGAGIAGSRAMRADGGAGECGAVRGGAAYVAGRPGAV